MMNSNVKTIKESLMDGYKYTDVIHLLEELMASDNVNFPVRLFIDENNRPCSSLAGDVIREQATMLYNAIANEPHTTLKELKEMNLYMLYMYMQNESDMRLHNYAVAASHRSLNKNGNSEKLLTNIRTYMVLSNLLVCSFNYDDDSDPEGIHDWSIPTGWYHYQKDDFTN